MPKRKKTPKAKTPVKKKRKSKRSQERYPALKPELNLKSRFEVIDYDYVGKLSEKEKDYLNRFTEEWANANFKHEGPRIMKTKEDERQSYARNNARNRCTWTKAKASGSSEQLEDLRDYQIYHGYGMSEEDRLIELLDQRNNRRNSADEDDDL